MQDCRSKCDSCSSVHNQELVCNLEIVIDLETFDILTLCADCNDNFLKTTAQFYHNKKCKNAERNKWDKLTQVLLVQSRSQYTADSAIANNAEKRTQKQESKCNNQWQKNRPWQMYDLSLRHDMFFILSI